MTEHPRNDVATVSALAVLAMCTVTFDHEALGHGGLCLALGGHLTLLTTSLFACDLPTIWLAPAGPAMNVFMGTLALIALRFVPQRRPELKLFLILVTAFSYFWEGGYIVQAMIEQKGDMYYAFRYTVGVPSPAGRAALAVPGVALYVLTLVITQKSLAGLGFGAQQTRVVARTAWLAATLAAFAASLASRHGWSNVRDTVMSIGLASVPLLIMSLRSGEAVVACPVIARRPVIIALAVCVLAVFVMTMGRGIG